MPLTIEIREGGIACPVVICDHCGNTINRAEDGDYQWSGDNDRLGNRHAIYFTHKICCSAFERSQPGVEFWGAMELVDLLPYLANNLRLDWQDAQHHARMMSEPLG